MFDLAGNPAIDWKQMIVEGTVESSLLLQMRILGLSVHGDMLDDYTDVFVRYEIGEREERSRVLLSAALLFTDDLIHKVPRFEHVHHALSPKGDTIMVAKIEQFFTSVDKFVLSERTFRHPFFKELHTMARSGDPRPAKWFFDMAMDKVKQHLNHGVLELVT